MKVQYIHGVDGWHVASQDPISLEWGVSGGAFLTEEAAIAYAMSLSLVEALPMPQFASEDDPDKWSFRVAACMYTLVHLQPEWYHHGADVWCFADKQTGAYEYSYDRYSCNATMYRRKDAQAGYADPLPHFAGDLGKCQEVIDWARQQGIRLIIEVTNTRALIQVSYEEKCIEVETPVVLATCDDSDIAFLICKAVVLLCE